MYGESAWSNMSFICFSVHLIASNRTTRQIAVDGILDAPKEKYKFISEVKILMDIDSFKYARK